MTEQEQVQLLPCPFCGGEARFVDGRLSINIRCGNYDCGITQRQYYYETTAEAIAAWNTRHTATAEALEAMREARVFLALVAGNVDWMPHPHCSDVEDALRSLAPRLTAAIAKIEGEQP